jgi:hypothetical protein
MNQEQTMIVIAELNDIIALQDEKIKQLEAQSEPMIPLRMEWESGYPEDVAFGSQRQMDRLKKWLDKYFAMVKAESEPLGVVEIIEQDEEGGSSCWISLHQDVELDQPVYAHPQPTMQSEPVATVDKRGGLI